MKIIDVISENNLNEANYVAPLEYLGKGISSAYKGLKGVMDSRGLVDALSQHPGFMKKILKGKPPGVAEIEATFGKEAGNILRNDDKIFAKALKKYHSNAAAEKAAVTSTEKSGTLLIDKTVSATQSIGAKLNSLFNWSVFGTFAVSIYSAISDAGEKIEIAKQKLAAGEITEELFNKYYKDVTNHAIARIGYNGLFISGLAGGGFVASKLLPTGLGWLARQITKSGMIWFNTMMADKKNYDSVLTAAVIDILAALVGKVNPLLPNTTQLVQSAAATTPSSGTAAKPSTGTGPGTTAAGQSANPADVAASSTPPQPGTDIQQFIAKPSYERLPSAGGSQRDEFERGVRDSIRRQNAEYLKSQQR